MKRYDVAAVGSGNIDMLFRVPSLPDRGGKRVGKLLDQQIGGTVANSACVMARLGVRVVSVSCVGDDGNGQKIMADFGKFNVNCDFVRTLPGHAANIAVIFTDDTGEKSLVYAPGDEPEWDDECVRSAIEQSYYIYTMPSDIDKFQKIATYAQQAKTKIIVDIEPHIASTPERLSRILSLADIVIFNKAGFIFGCGEEPEIENLQRLRQQYQLDAVVVTLDAEGVVAVTASESERRTCFNVPVIDTTGAGDAFNGAFICSIINNANLYSALEFSSAVAAISITASGARGHLPDVQEVLSFIRANE